MRTSRLTTAGAAGIVLAFGLGACSSTDSESDPSTTPDATQTEPADDMDSGTEDGTHDGHDLGAVTPEGTGDPFADARTAAAHMPETGAMLATGFADALGIEGNATSAAADLRSELTALLQEHVYLAGMGVATAYHAGPDSPEFDLAAEAIDANSVELADAVGALAGDEKREEFLERWREHIGYFVDYAVAVAGDDAAAAEEAVAELRQYTQDAGAFFEEISDGELPADAVTESLNGHVDTLAAAVDSLAAGEADAFANLQTASHHVVEGAMVLSEGLATAAELEGDPNDDASTLRAALTANLNEHVYVAGIAVFVAYTEGMDSDAFAAAAEVVDANAVELADAVGELAGEDQRDPFLELWRDHIGYFVDYAGAVATDDTDAAEDALADLDQYRLDAGAFFEEISDGELPADTIADGLAHHIQTLGGAIDSLNTALVQGSDDS